MIRLQRALLLVSGIALGFPPSAMTAPAAATAAEPAAATAPAAAPRYRTDADGPVGAEKPVKRGPKDKTPALAWFMPVQGEFPLEGTAHAVSGELMRVDHVERRFQIRVDRNDSQERGVWDLPLDAAMLPYGSILYHGQQAALQDLPMGTHLNGLFYLKDPKDTAPLPMAAYNRRSPEGDFRRCFRIEDDFSRDTRTGVVWKVDSVDLDTMKLTATPHREGKPAGPAKLLDLMAGTRVWKGSGFADLRALAAGQEVIFNLTWVTLYGPGRVVEVWLDAESRRLATARQLEIHRLHIRERGLPGWVQDVDDDEQIVTIRFFDNVDPGLFDEIRAPIPASMLKPGEVVEGPRGGIAVARPDLMTYDPVNDRKGGAVVDVRTDLPTERGGSPVQIKVKCDLLLEGYRPRKIVRFYPGAWRVIALPREEQAMGLE